MSRQTEIGEILARIAGLSQIHDFRWLVFNGLPQAQQLYGDPEKREAGDIDLLVDEHHSAAIARLLVADGFGLVRRRRKDPALGRWGLRDDPRISLTAPGSSEVIHLHERLFFAGAGMAVLADHRSRRSLHGSDIPAPQLGPSMALDILLRGNARRWARGKWRNDARVVMRLLAPDEQHRLWGLIEEAGFVPGAIASLSEIGLGLPAVAEPWASRFGPEIEARRQLYAASRLPMAARPVTRSVAHTIWARGVNRLSVPFRRPQQYTRETATRADRYPLVFHFLLGQLSDRDAPRLLSFGCSSGEEAFTLHQYLPKAAIKGIDVNPRQIARARRLSNSAAITFAVGGSAEGEASASYDAILCMAVFRDPTLDLAATHRADGPVTFAAFDRELLELVRCLKPGGLLFVAHSNFRVADTSAAGLLERVLHSDPLRSGLAPGLYGADGARIKGAVDRVVGYRKRNLTAV